MDSCLPTLTLDGFVTNKRMMFYKLWEYFLTSEYSQSNTFYGMICSYKHVLATAISSGNLVEAARSIEGSLTSMYKRYYDNVAVDCQIGEDIETNTQVVKIAVSCSDDSGKTYRLYKEIENKDSKIKNYESLLSELYEHYAIT